MEYCGIIIMMLKSLMAYYRLCIFAIIACLNELGNLDVIQRDDIYIRYLFYVDTSSPLLPGYISCPYLVSDISRFSKLKYLYLLTSFAFDLSSLRYNFLSASLKLLSKGCFRFKSKDKGESKNKNQRQRH